MAKETVPNSSLTLQNLRYGEYYRAVSWRSKETIRAGPHAALASGPQCNHSPAEPGAFVCEPLKAAIRGR